MKMQSAIGSGLRRIPIPGDSNAGAFVIEQWSHQNDDTRPIVEIGHAASSSR